MKKHSGLMFVAVGLLSLGLPSFAAAQAGPGSGQQTTLSDRKSGGAFARLPRPNGHIETDQEYRMRRVQELEQRLQPYINAGNRAANLARLTLRNMRMNGNISDAEWAQAHEINRDFPQ